MNKLFFLAFFYELLFFSMTNAQLYTVFGTITDFQSGEQLFGANIVLKDKNIGIISNSYGFYSIKLPAGRHTLVFSYLGYKTLKKNIQPQRDTLLNIALEISTTNLEEVVVKSKIKSNNISGLEVSSNKLNIETISSLPATMGEIDILKSLQLIPGIQTSHEGTTNLSIRGGSFDQNLFILDEAPVYNPSHALGFFSTFNSDAIKDVTVYKGSFSPKYGGRLSSVIDIKMKEGNEKKFGVKGGVGLIASRLTVEGPVFKNNSSFIVSGRYSYAGFMANNFGRIGQYIGIRGLRDFNDNNEINFYDLNAKFNYKLNNKNRIYLSAYRGRDHFYYFVIDNNSSMDWGNMTGALRWNHIFNSKVFSNMSLIYSKYDYSYILKDDARHFEWSSNLNELAVKADFDFYFNPANHIEYGFANEFTHYLPGKITPRDISSVIKIYKMNDRKTLTNSFYINNEQKVSEKISFSYGLRYSAFALIGDEKVFIYSHDMEEILDSVYFEKGELVKFYHGLEPRITLRYLINENSSVKTSYTRNKQYRHLLSNSSIGLPTDIWLPADYYIKPQYANQCILGYFMGSDKKRFEMSFELYYKTIHNIIDYKDNSELFLNNNVETQILTGNGVSYGTEILLQKNTGKLFGWLSYTLSKTLWQINGINNNEPYPARYDKRHNLSVNFSLSLNNYWIFSSTFKYTSGGFITIPEGTFTYYGASFNYYSEKNGYQLPSYHRLDISITHKNKNDKEWDSEWVIGINNIYNRKNIFSLFIKQDTYNLNQSKAYKMYLFGIIPYFTYNFKF